MDLKVKIIEDPNRIIGMAKIQAVKIVKDQLGLSLKEAKEMVEGKEFFIYEGDYPKLKTDLKACGYILDTVVNDSVAPVKIIDDKGMNYEEKYKEVLEKAKNWHANAQIDFKKSLEALFPELAESQDEKVRKEIIHLVKKSNEQGGYALHKDEADNMIAWLEKQSEQKPAWSKEDEIMLNEATYLIRREPYRENDAEPIVDWLKSLKGRVQPQNRWKPSDEQMSILRYFADRNDYDGTVLTSLYNDLKKLKEE